ncbi:MAG: phasin family protein [Rhodospirillales bacterium]
MTTTQAQAAKKAAGAKSHGSDDQALNDALVDTFVKSTETYIDWFTIWNREVAAFMARRLARQQDFARKVCECKDGADLVECQREWTETAQQDYADEFKKLTELGLSFAEKQAKNAEIAEN